MPEQVPFEQQQDSEDSLSIASYTEKTLNIQGSGSGGESTDSWSVVENSVSEEVEVSDEEEDEVQDQVRDGEDSYSIEEGSEQEQDEGYEDHDDEESGVSDQCDESSSCSSISLEDGSISSLEGSSISLEDGSVPSLSDSNSSSEGEEDSSENGSELNNEPDVTNTNPAPSIATSNTSNIAVYTSSLKSETTNQAASSNSAQTVPSSTTPSVGKGSMFFGPFKPRHNNWNLQASTFTNFQSFKHPRSASSVQVAPSSTAPSEISSLVSPTSEVPDNQEEIGLLQAAERTREELYRKIKMATKPEEVTVSASMPPQQEEDEAVKLWNEIGKRQFNALKNALLTAQVQAEFKQKVTKALESDVKKVEDLSMEQVQQSLICKQRQQQPPLVDIKKKEREDLVGERFCLVCSTGQVRIVAVNAGRNQRWQCVDCKEWYEWCPVVHPVSPKRARLLETGGWDDDYDQKQDQKESAQKVQEQEEIKPLSQQGDKKEENVDRKVTQVTQKEINMMSTVPPAEPVVVGQPAGIEQRSSDTVKPGLSSSKTLLFLLAAVWMVLAFALGYFVWKYSAEMETSAKFLQEVQNLRKDLKERMPTRHLEYIEYTEYITRVPHCGIPEAQVPSTFQAKLWLLFSTFFTFATNLVSTIEAQLQRYNRLDAMLLLYSLAAVCGALLMALAKCANMACKFVVIFLGIKSLLLFLTWLNGA